MRATAAPEEGNKVRLSVEVDEAEIDKALDELMRRLSSELRVPGFRPGKVPRKVIEARMGGAGAVRGEALREALPGFYAKAVEDTEVDPIDQPDIDITSGDESGPVAFDAVVLVRPSVGIPGYRGLQVTIPSLEATDEEVDAQIDRMRATSGELVAVGRPATDGDQVTIDVHGTPAGVDPDDAGPDDDSTNDLDAEDLLYEVGSATIVPELDEQLRGTKVGDILGFDSTPVEGGPSISFRVLVKDVKELKLPEISDAWASEESEFDTVEELRADIGERLGQRHVLEAQMAVQQGAANALVELVTEEIPEQLVREEMRERLHDLAHRLESQGMTTGQFLTATGRSEEDFLAELEGGALQSVKLDLALRALVEAEELDVTEEELDEELATMGAQMDMPADRVRQQLELAGRLPAVRSDRRKAKAMRWLVDHVELVDPDGAPVSRDDLRTDDGDEDSSDGEGPAEVTSTERSPAEVDGTDETDGEAAE